MTPERLAEIRRIATETGCSLLTEALDEIERLEAHGEAQGREIARLHRAVDQSFEDWRALRKEDTERRARVAELERELADMTERKEDLLEKRDALNDVVANLERELERWRHDVTIEGDFVCPDSLALNEARRELADLRRDQ